MTRTALSRRNVLEAGVCALVGAASAHAGIAASPTSEELVRKYYAAWRKKDWSPFDILLAEDFTFTSANNDDHISKSAFKTRCWESQIDFIEGFELERVIGNGDEVFVKYLGRTKNGKSFLNVDYFRIRNEKVEAIECYFGGQFGYPSAASTQQK